MHDGNDRAALGGDNSTNGNNGEVVDLMTGNTRYINKARAGIFVDDADIRSGKATIGATVNVGTMTGGMVVGDGIGGAFMDGDATVFLAVDRELVRRRRRGRARAEDTTEVENENEREKKSE